jgi:hypothetical protein
MHLFTSAQAADPTLDRKEVIERNEASCDAGDRSRARGTRRDEDQSERWHITLSRSIGCLGAH